MSYRSRDFEAGAYFFSFILFVLVGTGVGAIMESITALQGAGYGLLVWVIVCMGLPVCACIFD